MKIKILDKIINKKLLFAVLGIMLIGGIAFSVIQIVYAGYATVYTAPSPGHSWGQMANFTCPSGECLQSNSNGSLYCATCSGGGGSSYWTLSGSTLYNNSGSYVGINKTSASYALDVGGAIVASGIVRPGTYLDLSQASLGIMDYYGDYGSGGNILYKGSSGVVWGAKWNCTTVTVSAYNNYAIASCPSGYTMTGGGCGGGNHCGMTLSYPYGNGWLCANGNGMCNGYGDATAYARCCN